MSKEVSGFGEAVFNVWTKCGNCKQEFTGALGLEMDRRFWWRCRSSDHKGLRYTSMRCLAKSLENDGEMDTATQLYDEVSKSSSTLDQKLHRADCLMKDGQDLEALELLRATLPEAKACNALYYVRALQFMVLAFNGVGRKQEAYETATELVAFSKANFGPTHNQTLVATGVCAVSCSEVGRLQESKAYFDDLLTANTRILGNDHPMTQQTRTTMRQYGFRPAEQPQG